MLRGNVVVTHVVLVHPEIPNNTGAIIRLCANTGFQLHLIKPLAFSLDDKKLRRAGLDYHEFVHVNTWDNLHQCVEHTQPTNINLYSTKAKQYYHHANYANNSMLIFGSETKGLHQSIFDQFGMERFYRLPMRANSRSINLANTVSIVIYEAWKHNNFIDGA